MMVSNLESKANTHLTYRQRDDGIHELTYRQASHEAVDAFFEHIDNWAMTGGPDDIYCILNDLRTSGHQPLSYYFKRLREVNRKHPITTRPQARVALVYQNSPLVSMVQAFIRVVNAPGVRIRTFENAEYDSAVQWLLSECAQFHADEAQL